MNIARVLIIAFIALIAPHNIAARRHHVFRDNSIHVPQQNYHIPHNPFYVPEYTITLTPDLVEIEKQLHIVESRAIEAIQKKFSLIPQHEWDQCFQNIDEIKKVFHQSFKKSNNAVIHHTHFNWYSLVVKALQERGINPKAIDIIVKPLSCSALATIGWYTSFLTQSRRIIRKKIQPSTMEIVLDIDTINRLTSFASFQKEHVVHHEITHLLECHGVFDSEIQSLVHKYYPQINMEKDPVIIAYSKTHELIADLIPCILYPHIAHANNVFANKVAAGQYICTRSIVHPSFIELRPWLYAIDTAHKK